MAPPTKNQNADCNSNQNANNSCINGNNSNVTEIRTNTTTMRKSGTGTGTKPKTTTAFANNVSNVREAPLTAVPTNHNSTFSAMPLQQQHVMQQQQPRQQLRKNTEIVAPIRRDLNDLNDYLLTTVATTANSHNSSGNNNHSARKQQHNKLKLQARDTFNNQQNSAQQLQQINQSTNFQNFTENSSNNSATIAPGVAGYEIENLHENQRFCFPVRPIPRSNQQQQLQQNNSINLGSNLNSNLSNHAATIGVVIPTTPGLSVASSNIEAVPTAIGNTNLIQPLQQQQLEQQQNQLHLHLALLKLQQYLGEPLATALENQQPNQQNNLLDLATNILPGSAAGVSEILDANTLWQRAPILQKIIKLTEKKYLNNNSCAATPTTTQVDNKIKSVPQVNNTSHQKPTMVNPNSMDRDVIVNSASLEDVDLSETSTNRAQSIQSLHSSIETPTPDTSPTFEELQRRLEDSNRNIQNMQQQQQQLLQLQNAAKQHLNEMEQLRQQAGVLSFDTRLQNGSPFTGKSVPQYDNIGEVQSDMAALVGRMKNLTMFIQNQNELGNLLGDDGPEILAEQQNLQRKLESLRQQRDEMRNIVDELQDINRTAEKSTKSVQNKELLSNGNSTNKSVKETNSERIVPVEYTRVVPIELLQPLQPIESSVHEIEAENLIPAALMRQKASDIEAMKGQLKRLKEMMETVSLIEERTARDPKDICRIPERDTLHQSSEDRERTPTAANINNPSTSDDGDSIISRKVQILNEVSSDLREQAANLQAERDRIQSLKEEIVRRKHQAAAAAQLGEDALKRHSLTPTPTPVNRSQQQQQREESLPNENDQLKTEYEAKKKEFLLICQQLKEDENKETASSSRQTTTHREVMGSEADDETEEEVNDSDFTINSSKFYSAGQGNSTAQSCANTTTTSNTIQSTFGSSDNATTNNTIVNNTAQEAASIEAASVQSGSSQSYSMPPGMPTIGTSGWTGPIPPPLPVSWNAPYYYGVGMVPPPIPPVPHVGTFTPSQMHTSIQPLATIAPPSSTDCMCHATSSTITLGGGPDTATGSSSVSVAAQLPTDPILLQQFIQTQQMLINSVHQCNQMLWHQQREIDTLNNTVHFLQERLLAMGVSADLGFSIRSESVPPPALAGVLPNNLYTGSLNRAQSEQPAVNNFLPPPGNSTQRSIYSNYQQQQQLLQSQQQQQQHLFQQRQRGLISGNTAGYNYTSETQQQNTASASTSLFSTLNNAVPQQPQFNNEAPQSPLAGAGPGPIFMHHHNNAIHQNNSNLRTQNHYANNQQQQQPHNNATNIGGSNTLNNQVPPGNRANNYWDNFRSYSRQNLLSTNSNKSNEEQQQLQQLSQHDEQQPQPPYREHRSTSLTNLQQHHHMPHPNPQQHQQRQSHLYTASEHNLINNSCNNANYDNSNCNNKCFQRSLERSRINQLQQQHYQQNGSCGTGGDSRANLTNLNNPFPSNLPTEYEDNLHWPDNDVSLLYDTRHYNIFDNEMSTDFPPTSSSNLRNTNMNMNVNFGNSPHFQRNKVPAKQTYRAKPVTTTMNPQFSSQHSQEQLPTTQSPQQQQQSLQHFRNGGPTVLQNPQRFGGLLAAVNSEVPHSSTLNSRNHDFLLSTVDDRTDDFESRAVDVLPVNVAQLTVDNNAGPRHFEDDEDTTSEEIKRNLLVNALKNDKFTTKFYESIKEDVFRRLESMLLEKESDEEQQQSLQRQPTSIQSEYNWQPIFNDVSGRNQDNQRQRDPMRKLYLNARMCNQLQQQPQTRQMKHVEAPLFDIEIDEQDENNAETESNNGDNENIVLENDDIVENDKPEEDVITPENAVNPGDMSIVRAEPEIEHLPSQTKNTNRKRKSQRKSEYKNGGAALPEGAIGQQMKTAAGTLSKNATNQKHGSGYDAINYIIARIRNQTHQNTIINDTVLIEISKLTANAAQNLTIFSSALISSPNISPKKIYTKIKKLIIPRQRDEFLIWYKNYLETLFQIEGPLQQQTDQAGSKPRHSQKRNATNDDKSQKDTAKIETKSCTNVAAANPLNISNNTNLDVNDADLAEADQTCSANTSSNTSNILQVNETVELTIADLNVLKERQENADGEQQEQQKLLATTNTSSVKTELEEFENNENPDEDEEAGACGVQISSKENSDTDKKQAKIVKQQKSPPQLDLSGSGELSTEFVKRNGIA